ncbi:MULTISPECIES: dihydroorotase [Idiomarina]|uniref:dihydroorotase n=1 Tax=Idiomarina TaxID=135575 RepID=UPI000C44E62C|nr:MULTISPECIES: dihydroorotase [Idiomarina]MBP58593.1 dihydroorotase [Idiomarina sp.]|tara:strand:- start:15175 stop:16209 length:1035 start_codon:yes stop_codon:yes gene_type:complete
MQSLTIPRPDDWHLHLRDGAMLKTTVPASATVFHRTVVMPNLVPPVTTVTAALEYRARIMEEVPEGASFNPLMALYLTAETTPEQVAEAAANDHIIGFKLYPSGATTNSAAGVKSVEALEPVLAAMQEHGLPLLVHGEVTDSDIDIFDRERVFIERHLIPITERFPNLKLVLEHITTADAVEFVKNANSNVAATMTPQHLLMNRNDLLVGGIRPHNYCLPILKRRTHQQALQQAALSGSPKFFLGTDSAPHVQASKETACGCAGCYSAPAAIELYAEFFSQHNALDKLANFASGYGADFYQLPRNTDTIELVQQEWTVADTVDTATGPMVPYWAGSSLQWKLKC